MNKAHIGLLLLNEKIQRKGIGAQVYSKLEEYLLHYPFVETIRLSVVETNKSVMSFWEKCGFKSTGVIKPYTNKKVTSQAIIMEKPFGKRCKSHIQ
jgi:ribosomal protein S18 acetylase RimI-like enzyme